jgi:broad specificity phosphatase PhoE
MENTKELWLVRHGETEWSKSGRHTGRTDIPLSEIGVRRAERLESFLRGKSFSLVLTSPLQRALETCRLAGYGERAQIDSDLSEWDYGVFEGRKTSEIRAEIPSWSIWNTDVPGGETIDQVAARADRVIRKALDAQGDVALFSHGHVLRILAARWLDLPPRDGRLFALDTGAVNVLGYERETRVLRVWNRSVSAD